MEARISLMELPEGLHDPRRRRGTGHPRHLGFTTRHGLCKATYSRALRRIGVAAFEARVAERIRGRVVTGDATSTRRDICTVITDGGGDCIPPAKGDRPTLARDIAAAFAEPEAPPRGREA